MRKQVCCGRQGSELAANLVLLQLVLSLWMCLLAGIRAKFQHISCFRHNPVYRMNRNDIYFVCLLTLEDDEIPEPTPDPKGSLAFQQDN